MSRVRQCPAPSTAEPSVPRGPIATWTRPRRPVLRVPLLAALVVLTAACDDDPPDAYGNFEADEVTVSAEATGTLQVFDVAEGQRLAAGAVVGQVDTVPLALQRDELQLQVRNAGTRSAEAVAQLRSLEAQLATAEEDLARTERLFEREAATAAERTRLQGTVSSLREQVDAARARSRLAGDEADVVRSRIRQLQDRIDRATVRNPVAGTVLARIAEAGEYVQQGRPLYTVAALDTLTLRAYLSGGQLASVRLGDRVGVRYDAPDGGLRDTVGRVTWIADRAEFTPTPIQTREERVDQVYAVKIRVPNPEGVLKIGMPGEVVLSGSGTGQGAGPSGAAAAEGRSGAGAGGLANATPRVAGAGR